MVTYGQKTEKVSMFLPEETIIAAGPVIIENGKVLLNREKKRDGTDSPYFMFPGGKMETPTETFEAVCIREAKEELGIDIEILRPLKPMLVYQPNKPGKMAILIHYLAKRKSDIHPGPETLEWNWFDIHHLPENCTPNVREVIEAYLSEQNI